MPNPSKSKLRTTLPANLRAVTAATTTISRYELAARLGTSVDTLDRLHHRGVAPPRFKLGWEWRYVLSDVEAWIAERLRAEVHRERQPRKRAAHQTEVSN